MSSCSAHRNAVSKVAKGPPLIGAEAGTRGRRGARIDTHGHPRSRRTNQPGPSSIRTIPSAPELRRIVAPQERGKGPVTSDEQEKTRCFACHSSLVTALRGLAGFTADREL